MKILVVVFTLAFSTSILADSCGDWMKLGQEENLKAFKLQTESLNVYNSTAHESNNAQACKSFAKAYDLAGKARIAWQSCRNYYNAAVSSCVNDAARKKESEFNKTVCETKKDHMLMIERSYKESYVKYCE